METKRTSSGPGWLRSHPAIAFFVLTYLFSWSVWGGARVLLPDAGVAAETAAHTLGLFGPTLAALVLTGWLYGAQGVRNLLKRIGLWRAGFGWYLFALFSTLGVGLAALGVHALAGGTNPPQNPLASVLPALLPLPAGLPEEYGWRGFALPHLMRRHGALASSLLIAVLWVLWHIPISPILSRPPLLALFLLEVMPLSVLFSWLYINSRGSILLAVLFHLAANCAVTLLNIPGAPLLWVIYIGLTWSLAALVVFRYGPSRLSRNPAAQVEGDLWGPLEP